MGSDLSRQLAPYQKGTAAVFAVALAVVAYLNPRTAAGSEANMWFLLIHLGSFSLMFGVQFWVTFVAGLTKLRILPRHWFGAVQTALFRKYFVTNMLCSGALLGTFLLENPVSRWKGEVLLAGSALTTGLVATLLGGILVEPRVSCSLQAMYKIEKERGCGEEIGAIKDQKLLEDPTYKPIRSKFLLYHSLSTLANLCSFTMSGVYLWFLSGRLRLA